MYRHTILSRRLRVALAAGAVLLSLLCVLVLAGCASTGASAGPASPATSVGHTPLVEIPEAPASATALRTAPPGSSVFVYFSRNPESFNDPTAVFSVQRVAPTSAVATYAIQLLIAGPTLDERTAGYFSELNSLFTGPSGCSNGSNPTGGPDFTLTLNKKGSSTEQGAATLQFCRPTSSPGIGADARISAEIHKTLTQFSTITKVVILLRNGHCFGDASGMDRCLT